MPDLSSTREIIVTGAHRSGTSAISNFLSNLGIDVGDPQELLSQAQDNQKGFFERLDVMQVNDAILECANSSWDHPDIHTLSLQQERTVPAEIEAQIKSILNSFQNSSVPFLLKDPRFSLTLPIWFRYLSSPLIIFCLRNPLEIGRSLQNRNGFSIYKSLAIWESYLWLLSRNCQNHACLYVNFNRIMENPEKYGGQLVRELSQHGITSTSPLSEAINRSFDSTLKHEECNDRDLESLLSVRQMELWQAIKQGSSLAQLSQKYGRFDNPDAIIQKDTNIGYSRLEIKLFVEFLDEDIPAVETTLLVGNKDQFVFDVQAEKVKSFRLEPLNRPCVIQFLSFEVFSQSGMHQGEPPQLFNGSFDPISQWYYFPQENPYILYESTFSEVARVKVKIVFAPLEIETTKTLLLEYYTSLHTKNSKQLRHETATNLERKRLLSTFASHRKIADSKGLAKQLLAFFHVAKLALTPKDFFLFIRYYKQIAKQPGLFSTTYYTHKNTDVNSFLISPLLHFFVYGWREDRDPSPDFNVQFYLESYSDVKASGLNPLLHYIAQGWREGRDPSPAFNTNRYLATHPEVFSSGINPLSHRQRVGGHDKSDNSIKFEPLAGSNTLAQAVTIIIPVYLANAEAVNTLHLLLSSLAKSYPGPKEKLSFLFINDASPLGDCETILTEYGFLERSDVRLIENEKNLGFTRTINRGIQLASRKSDVVILNSDTEIYGSIFEILQRACYRKQKVASVTPVSNRATVFSLFNWPFGSNNTYSLAPEELAETVEKIGLIGPSTGAPTGHGYCMYMSRRALKDIGIFDAETFGQGYGEENDWSLRAIRAGYTHQICTECFVYHHESKSFDAVVKAELQKENSPKLTQLHPYYPEMVEHFLNKDPLKNHRKILKLFLLEKEKIKKNLKTVCFIIHDSYKNHEGGVQQHVKQLLKSLPTLDEFELMVISPDRFEGELYEIHLFQQHEALDISHLSEDTLSQILPRLESRVDYLHVHHTHGLHSVLTDWIQTIKSDMKILTIHDYDLFCENPFLLDSNGIFCLASDDNSSCENNSCKDKSSKSNSFLQNFDSILVPSNNCKHYLSRLTNAPHITDRIEVLPHCLPFADEISAFPPAADNPHLPSKNIVFLGSLYPHKGGDLYLQSTETLRRSGYQTHIWGHAQQSLLAQHLDAPKVLGYKNWRELSELYHNYGAHIVVIPAVCAETFSYTLYEALFLFEVPVVVGPHGNPAEVTKAHAVGEVIAEASPAALLSAIKTISDNYSSYLEAVRKYKQRFLSEFTTKHYLERYSEILLGQKKTAVSVAPDVSLERENSSLRFGNELFNKTLNQRRTHRLHVLIVHALTEQDPPYFFRVENPIKYLEKMGCTTEVCHLDKVPFQAGKYDLIFLSRTPLTERLEILLNNAKARKVPTVLDVDDLIFHSDFLDLFYFLEDSPRERPRYLELLGGLEKTFSRADILLGSTPEISTKGQQYGKNSIYSRNMLRHSKLELYNSLFASRIYSKKYDIGYFCGSNTHKKDFELLAPALTNIINSYPETQFIFMGFPHEDPFLQSFSNNITVEPFNSYEHYLKTVQQCRVVISPIAEINAFSQAKSNIKFLEAAAVGTPIISTPIKEMRYCIENGVTGWLAGNEEQWLKHIETAIVGDYAQYVGALAHAYVMERFSDGSQSFYNLLNTIVDKGLSE